MFDMTLAQFVILLSGSLLWMVLSVVYFIVADYECEHPWTTITVAPLCLTVVYGWVYFAVQMW